MGGHKDNITNRKCSVPALGFFRIMVYTKDITAVGCRYHFYWVRLSKPPGTTLQKEATVSYEMYVRTNMYGVKRLKCFLGFKCYINMYLIFLCVWFRQSPIQNGPRAQSVVICGLLLLGMRLKFSKISTRYIIIIIIIPLVQENNQDGKACDKRHPHRIKKKNYYYYL